MGDYACVLNNNNAVSVEYSRVGRGSLVSVLMSGFACDGWMVVSILRITPPGCALFEVVHEAVSMSCCEREARTIIPKAHEIRFSRLGESPPTLAAFSCSTYNNLLKSPNQTNNKSTPHNTTLTVLKTENIKRPHISPCTQPQSLRPILRRAVLTQPRGTIGKRSV